MMLRKPPVAAGSLLLLMLAAASAITQMAAAAAAKRVPPKKNLTAKDLQGSVLARMSYGEARDRLTPQQMRKWQFAQGMGPALQTLEKWRAKGTNNNSVVLPKINPFPFPIDYGVQEEDEDEDMIERVPGQLESKVGSAVFPAFNATVFNTLFASVQRAFVLGTTTRHQIFSSLWEDQVLDTAFFNGLTTASDIGLWNRTTGAAAAYQRFLHRSNGQLQAICKVYSKNGAVLSSSTTCCANGNVKGPGKNWNMYQLRATNCGAKGSLPVAYFSTARDPLFLTHGSGHPLFRIHLNPRGQSACLTASGRYSPALRFTPCERSSMRQHFYTNRRPSGYPSINTASVLLPYHYLRCDTGYLTSPDNNYQLRMQCDGNLVLYDVRPEARGQSPYPLWATNTYTGGWNVDRPPFLHMQGTDGNLVLCEHDATPIWATMVFGIGASLGLTLDNGPVLAVRVVDPLRSSLAVNEAVWMAKIEKSWPGV